MSDSSWRKHAVESVRLTVYSVLIINGVFIQYFAPFHYICDYSNQPSLMCGMTTAVDLWLSGKFEDAIESNPLILALVVAVFVMVADTVFILRGRYRRKKKGLQT